MRCVVRNPEAHQGKRPSNEAQMTRGNGGRGDAAARHALDALRPMNGQAHFRYQVLLDLLAGRDVADVACPLCSPHRNAVNRKRPVLRLWRVDERMISFCCVHCGASGCAWEGGEPGRIDPGKLAETRRQRDALNAEAIAGGRERARRSMPAASRSPARWAKSISASIGRSPANCRKRWASCTATTVTRRPS